MRFTRSRAALLGAAAITLTLTACAPPGADGEPGVAATYEGTSVTNGNIDTIYQAWLDDTKGQDVANRRQVLTIELLRDDLLAEAEHLGYPIPWATAKSYADQWLMVKGEGGTASDEVVSQVQGILALYIVANVDPTLDGLAELSDNVAKSAVVSPRSGAYSTDALLESVRAAMTSAENQQLGQFAFVEYQNVSAFTDADRSWFDRG